MVGISLYNGNLHKVADVPRRWPSPTPKISLKDFRTLLRRRSRALSRLRSSSDFSDTDGATNSNPSLAYSPNHSDTDRGSSDDDVNDRDGNNHVGHHPESLTKGDLKEGEGEMEKRDERTDAVQRNEENDKDDDKSEVIANTVGQDVTLTEPHWAPPVVLHGSHLPDKNTPLFPSRQQVSYLHPASGGTSVFGDGRLLSPWN